MTWASFNIEGFSCVVAGGAGGIGSAISHAFASSGAKVALLDLDATGLRRVADSLRSIDAEILTVETDLSDHSAVNDAFRAVDSEFNSVDVLVNTTWVPRIESPEDMSPDTWKFNLDTNLSSYWYACQAAGKRMLAQHRGSIINVSSIAATSAIGRSSLAYSVCKAAINMLTKELAVEWAGRGVRVNAIQPCQVKTPALEQRFRDSAFRESFESRILPGIPIGRLAEPEDLTGAVLFLASNASAMVTGVSIPIDGGNLAMNAGGTPGPAEP